MSTTALALVYLAAMVLTVPIARRLGLGTVLGYLLAGVALGPSALNLLGQSQHEVSHLAEFGVIMMLFLIGLELRPSVLWRLRGPIFLLGTLQVALSAGALMGIGVALGAPWRSALAGGLILALSSTAIVLQTLQEKGVLKTTGGQTSFAVLLFQDIAVIPMLALFPLLGSGAQAPMPSPLAWDQGLKILGAVALVILAGKYLARPLFRIVLGSRLRELSTAMALLLVLAITLLMNVVGLSPALGAFLAGVVLADSEYRHQLETDIEPFKGLLLGLFFISVGASIRFAEVMATPGLALGTLAALLGVKWLVLYATGKLGKLPRPDTLLFAFSLAQGGEFAFVLMNYAQRERILEESLTQSLTAAVALSMFFAPMMIQGYIRYLQPRFADHGQQREQDEIDERDNPAIVAGFGRFGQMVTRLLRACGVRVTVLDFDAEQVDIVRRFGTKAYYGDASNMDLLRSAGAEQATLLVLAIDDQEKALEMIETVHKEFPRLKILARAYDRLHAYEMIHRGIEHPYIETAGSALNLGIEALRALGFPAKQAHHAAQVFNRHNDQSIRELAKIYMEEDESTFVAHSRNWLQALAGTLQSDRPTVISEADRAWESAPRSKAQQQDRPRPAKPGDAS